MARNGRTPLAAAASVTLAVAVAACSPPAGDGPDARADGATDATRSAPDVRDGGVVDDLAPGDDDASTDMDAGGEVDAGTDDDAVTMDDDADAGDDASADDDADALEALDAVVPSGDASSATVCALAGDEPIVSNPGDSRFVSLVWTGTEFGAAWQDNEPGNDEIYFARIAPDGTVMGHARLTDDPGDDAHASLAYDGAGYAVAWSNVPDGADATTPGAIRFARVPDDALARGADGGTVAVAYTSVLATNEPGVAQPALLALPASAGGGFAVAWEDGRNGEDNHEIYFARLDASGHRAAAEVRVTNAPSLSYYPLLAWNDARAELALVWLDGRDDAEASLPNEEVYFARLLPSGARPSGAMDVRITHDDYRSIWPSVAYDGAGYAVVWANEDAIPDAPHIFADLLDPDGAPRDTAGPRPLSHNPEGTGAWANAVAWNGAEHLVVWEDQRHPMGDLVVQRLGPDGAPLTGEVFLHSDSYFTSHPSLVRAGDGWAVAWEDERGGNRDVYFRALGRTDCLAGM